MIWESGKLLTAEQTAQLARMTGKDRDRKVQLIAERLRKHAEDTQLRHGAHPQHRYAANLGDDVAWCRD